MAVANAIDCWFVVRIKLGVKLASAEWRVRCAIMAFSNSRVARDSVRPAILRMYCGVCGGEKEILVTLAGQFAGGDGEVVVGLGEVNGRCQIKPRPHKMVTSGMKNTPFGWLEGYFMSVKRRCIATSLRSAERIRGYG